jgi:hypothetical protein
MLEKTPTLGSIETTDAQKMKYANDSLRYNCTENKTFYKLFPDLVELHKARKPEPAQPATTSGFGDRTAGATAAGGVMEGAWLGGVNNWYVLAVAAAIFAFTVTTVNHTFS